MLHLRTRRRLWRVCSTAFAAAFEDWEDLFSRLKNGRQVTEENLVRHFTSNQQALEREKLGNAFWLPGPENPADGLTKENGYLDPPLSFLKAGSFFPGTLRPLRWVATREFPEGQVPRPCVSVAILFFPRARVNFFAHFS